ncbi:TIGR02391 family protein [Parabacteroides johnsonii]|uniref:TIGR02391 family protein n=1 Tax=Parabacteroides johnsonii TaxID=387661 RepID=UPI0024326F91|nr:TIGR02391 family protein [Parabacteroides johnsonii]
MESPKLKMSFDPHTIEHLGIKMYSVLPNAIAELIANAYDAEAHTVHVKLYNDNGNKRIAVIDDGIGMSFDEINNNFLRIGRKRRADDNGLSPNGIRKVTGRKGLGKLAFFGIGDTIRITTCQNGKCVKFTLSWVELMSTNSQEYEPKFSISECDAKQNGTIIELDDLKRKSDFDKDGLAISLSKLFNFFDDTFKVYISYNEEDEVLVDNKLKYQNLLPQISWDIPNKDVKNEYLESHNVIGRILATEKPLKPGLRGITLFAHGRLVNAPEFFGVGESSHGYSYLTGWLNVDFIDELEEDVISTDRQSLSWDLPVTSELQVNLKQLLSAIERDWRNKRKIERQKRISSKVQIDIKDWYGKLPSDVKSGVENIVNNVVENSELADDKQTEVVGMLHALIPEYANYHWRHMHSTVKDASYEDYKNADFYRAVEEAIKRYETIIQKVSGLKTDGQTLMGAVFGKNNAKLSVTSKYKRIDGSDFSDSTKENIEDGQKFMSMGLMAGVRNPLAHEEKKELKTTNLFSEKDCLDILSLISHLFRRLDDAEKLE